MITQNESVVTPSGNSGHVVVPKTWIGKEAIIILKEKEKRGKGIKRLRTVLTLRWLAFSILRTTS